MRLHGVSHIGLSTLDLDATRTFYERVLGFRLVTIEQIDLEEGGCIRMPSSIAATANSSASWSLVVSKQYQRRTTPASTEASACPTGFTI
jgi:hypothetical protein